MDTRNKIVGAADCRGAGPLTVATWTVATGYFDPLLAWHTGELARIREGGDALAVVVLPLDGQLMAQRSRAEVVAALRMVDYVLLAENGDLDRLFAELKPAAIVRLEEDDLRRRRELIENVRRRQIR